jgi:transposase
VGSSGKRTRGANKRAPWRRTADDGVSVLRLALDVSDPLQRSRIETLFQDSFALRRALQRGVRDACTAYRAATNERAADPAAVRERLGLTRTALEHRAYAHLDAAPHLRRGMTKALAMHQADSVWTSVERHLFRDATGNRQGLLGVGRWYDFRRIPGRARSHTTDNKWETFRLHGSLAGHHAAYTDASGTFVQPRRLRPVDEQPWWTYDGPLAVVCTGLGVGTLVLPVRLPTAPSNQPMLDHHLADPSRWHKIDLVRSRAPNQPGGWRYEAHLLVLIQPYVSPTTAERRARAAIETMDRSAGIDVNVSNVSVASHDTGQAMRLTRIDRDEPARQRDRGRARRERRRQRQIDRSRRATNRAQYQLSKRQAKRARRREAAGLPPVEVIPMGPRVVRADGRPLQRYRRDVLSKTNRWALARHAAGQQSEAQARRDRARVVAAEVVATHGYQLVVEDTSIQAWARSWGRALALLSPAMLVSAIDREARAVAAVAGATNGGVVRAATSTTALSQHCPCGARVSKRLGDRVHLCSACGLRGDRDAVAAILASFVVLVERGNPASARVDYDASLDALGEIRQSLRSSYQGWQDTLSESTDLSARDGSCVTWPMSTLASGRVARRNVGTASCATRNEPGLRQTTSERARVRTDRSSRYGPVWGTYGTTLRAS